MKDELTPVEVALKTYEASLGQYHSLSSLTEEAESAHPRYTSEHMPHVR